METLGRAASDVGRSVAALVHLSDDAALIKKINDEPQPRATIAGDANQLVDIVGAYQDLGLTELIVPDFHLAPEQPEKMDLWRGLSRKWLASFSESKRRFAVSKPSPKSFA